MSASTGTTVTVLVAALVLVGVAMIGVAVWLVRATRSDPPALGPLEVMGARRWRRGDADRRQTKLDTARPAGAPPLAPIVAFEPAAGDGDVGQVDGDPAATEPDTDPDPEPESEPEPERESEPDTDPEPEPGGAEKCEPSMQESAVSAHSSPDDAPGNRESDLEANAKE
jgi:hypothetical protein